MKSSSPLSLPWKVEKVKKNKKAIGKIAISLLALLTSCSSTTTEEVELPFLMDDGNIPAIQVHPVEEIGEEEENLLSTTPGVDIDLTQLSPAMVYGVVFQMVFYPEEYVGQTVRMSGDFFVYINPDTQQEYYSTIVEDALACCQQGLEFILKDGNYPEDYPIVDSEITVTGELELYAEHGYENIRLIDAVLS